jgi:undecaprenyl diphosphate synthase
VPSRSADATIEKTGGAEEEQLRQQLMLDKMPQHVAIIMDGNRRWASRQRLRILQGHQAGAQTTRMVIEVCSELNVPLLTLYAFSTENWQRPKVEVTGLMRLIEQNLRRELPEMHQNNVQIRHIGHIEELPASLQRQIREAIELTQQNQGLVLNLAINYGGRREIVAAARTLADQVRRGLLTLEQIDEQRFAQHLFTQGCPDPDLLIRTGGEMRVSNFLTWQMAYAELWVTPTLWPDFTKADFLRALLDYQQRERRFGATAT